MDGGRKADAFELAVAAIARKQRTVAELRGWLDAREVAEDDAADAIERLIAIGELDDGRYAEGYAADKRELRGWGPERIREALIERGIERSLAEAAAGDERPEEQAERAADLLAKRGDSLAADSERGRALAFLARRGYDLEIAYQAVRLAQRRAA